MQLANIRSSVYSARNNRPLAALVPRVLPAVSSSSSSDSSSSRLLCRAEPEQGQSQPAATEQQPAAAPGQPTQQEAPSAPLLAKGQGTAIVTGAISIIFGIAYLVLVQLLDLRGGELQPPPPEAYIP